MTFLESHKIRASRGSWELHITDGIKEKPDSISNKSLLLLRFTKSQEPVS
ncbi:MAG: hypothetical protein QUS12_15390 [Methanosarcina sp.]|nr:hypothetical protein [Methanosarcina sp.]